MPIKASIYLDFIRVSLEICSLIPLHFSKYSNKIYNNHQLITLLVFKQRLKISYKDLVEDLKTRESILRILRLHRLPDPSTIRKFVGRLDTRILHCLLGQGINLTRKRKLNLGIDATGYHLEDGSYHYRRRLGKQAKVRKNLKLSIVVETDKQLILTANIRKSNAHDNKDFLPLIKKAAKIKPTKIVVADKGYDSEDNYKFVIKELNAKATIAYRDYGKKRIPRSHRKYRNIAIKHFDEKEYHQRSKVETINFVMKRLFSSTIRAKKWIMQKKELLLKCIAYNIYRLVVIRRVS